ncbi:hypothetical protein [Nitrosomonas sp.]|uniref:hypothetical protein n=1 Tax=Nitrosomonas sp. TaxID=42353 RepID=UPI00262F13F6|nr:hypothetical protein [Nitrosomonas sp.]MCW5602885.1 hypothetical protein [Nitrosomonas sp.]
MIALVVFVLVMSALGYLFEEELTVATDWLVSRIGFLGLCLILLVTDTLVTPFPPRYPVVGHCKEPACTVLVNVCLGTRNSF